MVNAGWDYWCAEELLCLICLEGKELNSPFGCGVLRSKGFNSLVRISWAQR